MLTIADRTFKSRLFTGTGKFASRALMEAAIEASKSELVTIALKRVNPDDKEDDLTAILEKSDIHLLPNTSGVRTAAEAVFVAKMAREAFQTNWIKLEIHPDPKYLMPDPVETLYATEELVKEGFVILPYISADPVICKRLEDAGAAAVMPLGAAIGSNQGLKTRNLLEIIIEQANVPVVIDAGIGAPSQAAEALEMGADAVLVNTAIAVASDPVLMAQAFKQAVIAGRNAFKSGLAGSRKQASPTSLTGFLSN